MNAMLLITASLNVSCKPTSTKEWLYRFLLKEDNKSIARLQTHT